MAATKHAEEVKSDTKEFITAAVMQMLESVDLKKLTVSDVCKRAGVSRMAFYRNFEETEQVLYEHYRPKLAAVFEMLRQNTQDSVKLENQQQFFDAFGDSLLLASSRGFEDVVRRIFTEEMEQFYALGGDDYWTAFMTAGVYALWRKWLLDGRQKPLEEITGFLKRITAAYGHV